MVRDSYDVFISYSRADAKHAAEIDSFLRANGLTSFIDSRELAPGLPWVPALERAMNSAKAVIVLLGARLGNTQQYERQFALVRQARDPTFPVVPVMLPGATTDRPFDFLHLLTWVDFSKAAHVSEAPDALARLLAAIRGEAEGAVQEAICPYRGLDAFREEDAAFFFGRGSTVDELVRKVREHPFVLVVGRSGSGKSSLVYAGLLPALRQARDQFWSVLSLSPGRYPLRALAAAFNPRAEGQGIAEYEEKIGNEAERLRTGDPELLSHMILGELQRTEGRPERLLLYVDQWEELYAQAPGSGDEQQARKHAVDVSRFIDLLLTAARTGPVTVVGTVRADFYDPLMGHPEIKSFLSARQVLVGAMSRDELKATIAEPARRLGLAFDPPDLVERILDEAGEDEGMLPLLQYALKETWNQREGSAMTAGSYARSGGVREAIRVTAERAFDALPATDKPAARQLFLRLVTPGEGQEDTRARAAMPTEPAQRRIVEQFAGPRIRLLVTGVDRAARPTVTVAHEALIRSWPQLREWINANREKLRARGAILKAKAEWDENDRRRDLLLPAGFQLERGRTLLADPGDIPIADIEEFIELSSKKELDERENENRALASQARRALTRRWAAAAVAVLALIASGVVGWLQWINARAVERARADILAEFSASMLARGEIDSAIRLALRGVRIDLEWNPTRASRAASVLTATIDQGALRFPIVHDAEVTSAAFSPDGSRIVTHAVDLPVQVWDAATGRTRIASLPGSAPSFGPDGTHIVTVSGRTAQILHAATGAESATLRGHSDALKTAAFSRDGSFIVTASRDGTARIWHAGTGASVQVLRGHDKAVSDARFNHDGTRVVTASEDGTARIWNARTGTEIAILRGHRDVVLSAAFSPDGARVATASQDYSARTWDIATAEEITALRRDHGDPVLSAAFSPDGAFIVTTTGTTARVWDAVSDYPPPIKVLRGHQGTVRSAAFSPDGRHIVTASDDKTARVWSVVDNEGTVLARHSGAVWSSEFSPDGSRIVTASEDRTARVWDAASATMIALLAEHDLGVWSSSFSPDGLRIATASRDRTVRIWDAATYQSTAVLRGLGQDSPTAAFSPDGSRVVTTSTGRTGRIWDVAGGKEVAQLGVGNFEAFSPDWKRLVEVEFAQARVRDAASLREIAVLGGHDQAIWSAAFSSDGTRIVTASEDRTSRVWDAATGRELGVLRGHRGIVRFAAFSRDGTRIVTTSDDKTARIWDAATAKEIGILRGHRESVRSAAFDPARPRVVTASEDGTARVWNVDLQFTPLQDVIAQACARLSRLSQMTRDEMRLAGYPDSEPLVDVCP